MPRHHSSFSRHSISLYSTWRAALRYRGVEFDPKTLKPQLKLMLEQNMQLPTDGECPPFELPDAPSSSVDPVDAAADDDHDSSSSDGSADSDEEELCDGHNE